MKYFIILLFFIYSCFDIYGQLDTIKLSEMKSDNVFIIADVEDLIKCFGMPSSIHEDGQYRCNSKFVYSKDKDTVFYFNSLSYYKNSDNKMSYIIERNGRVCLKSPDFKTNKKGLIFLPNMSYIEKNGRVRLTGLDFKINKTAVIYTPKLKLSRKLRLSELLRAYQYPDDFEKVIYPIHIYEKSRRVYCVAFSTGEHECATIELYFDHKKKLRYMSIGAYGF